MKVVPRGNKYKLRCFSNDNYAGTVNCLEHDFCENMSTGGQQKFERAVF